MIDAEDGRVARGHPLQVPAAVPDPGPLALHDVADRVRFERALSRGDIKDNRVAGEDVCLAPPTGIPLGRLNGPLIELPGTTPLAVPAKLLTGCPVEAAEAQVNPAPPADPGVDRRSEVAHVGVVAVPASLSVLPAPSVPQGPLRARVLGVSTVVSPVSSPALAPTMPSRPTGQESAPSDPAPPAPALAQLPVTGQEHAPTAVPARGDALLAQTTQGPPVATRVRQRAGEDISFAPPTVVPLGPLDGSVIELPGTPPSDSAQVQIDPDPPASSEANGRSEVALVGVVVMPASVPILSAPSVPDGSLRSRTPGVSTVPPPVSSQALATKTLSRQTERGSTPADPAPLVPEWAEMPIAVLEYEPTAVPVRGEVLSAQASLESPIAPRVREPIAGTRPLDPVEVAPAPEAIPSAVQELPQAVAPPASLPVPISDAPVPMSQEAPVRGRDLAALVEESVSRFLASTGPSQPRQVRIELKGEVYAGVWISLQEVGGQVQVDLVCASEAARLQLGALVLREADAMARRCRRDLLVRVVGDPRDDDDTDRPTAAVTEVVGRA